ncbi:Uncharacterised protein [Klebsiella pneumoniae]|nr:Uncharacterised protein [Klebsiella pneumoniae]
MPFRSIRRTSAIQQINHLIIRQRSGYLLAVAGFSLSGILEIPVGFYVERHQTVFVLYFQSIFQQKGQPIRAKLTTGNNGKQIHVKGNPWRLDDDRRHFKGIAFQLSRNQPVLVFNGNTGSVFVFIKIKKTGQQSFQ